MHATAGLQKVLPACDPAGMSTTELMQMGRRDVKDTDASLLRSERIVNDTIQIGVQTAETLDQQTKQLEKVRSAGGVAWLLRGSGIS